MPEESEFLAYGRHLVDEEDIAAVARALRSGWLTTGPNVAAFERAVADRVGAPHAIACSSGTAALHMAMLALRLGPGDAVIVPSITFLATANAARFTGAEVLFADVDPQTGLVTAEHVREALARAGDLRPRAAVPVHLNGQCADVAEIARAAPELTLVEDASHAFGTTGAAGAPVGECRHSAMTTFSFHAVKAIALAEGGVVTTGDDELARLLGRARNHGIVREPDDFADRERALDAKGGPNPWYYELHELGLNYRASDLHCALGLSQLAKLERFLARRRALVERYDELLEGLEPIVSPVARVRGCVPAWHLYVVHIDFEAAGIERAAVMHRLREAGVGSQVHYIPVHRQPYYARRYGHLELSGAERYYARALSLPLHPGISSADQDRVVGALRAALGSR